MPNAIIRVAAAVYASLILICSLAPAQVSAEEATAPVRVEFTSLDRKVILTGYLFAGTGKPGATLPAVVMMHGRAGAYSSLANGRYDATTLSKRHLAWGRLWAHNGVTALLVDGFSARGFPHGFPIHSYSNRPAAVDEVSVRPSDAYAALDYLASRPDVDGRRIGLQGWSNGGSATLAAMNDDIRTETGSRRRFRAALALYPACGLHAVFDDAYSVYAPTRVFAGTADEEVSANRCVGLVRRGKKSGSDIAITVFEGATHDFDDPGPRRQRVAANRAARAEVIQGAVPFMLNALAN